MRLPSGPSLSFARFLLFFLLLTSSPPEAFAFLMMLVVSLDFALGFVSPGGPM